MVKATTGSEQASTTSETTRRGYEQLVARTDRYTITADRAWAVEGSGSYGAGFCSHLLAAGEQVVVMAITEIHS